MAKVLIANRGEIACRIQRTCRTLGLATVAVYSEADADAQHARLADEAWPIGPAPVRESYLNQAAILAAARQSGADMLHPGYGLLSENPQFAEAVTAAGLVWIGPAATTIAAMSEKSRAREIAINAGVPVLPGSPALDADDTRSLATAAASVGFPLVVKAVAGGGGIGMRRESRPDALPATARSVSDLSARMFGDRRIFLERHVEPARHIEVQVFGLGDGRVFHLHERECSIQRRFQKVIEEAPAPRLPDRTRIAMIEAACRLAAAQDYAGAGTVEFIVDAATGAFFFLEMNTRIQVEHPVTEQLTGIDIVALQLQLAAGKPPDHLAERSLTVAGHAIECRLYAENPARRFLPSPGRLLHLVLPDPGPELRVDTGYASGDLVTPHYDPMIAKIVASGTDRDAACDRLARALGAVSVAGIATNAGLLRRIIDHPAFRDGSIDTGFLERNVAELTS